MKTLLKRFLLIAFFITPIVLLINYSFISKAKDKPDLQNKSSKTASKSEKKIEDQEITLTFSGDTMFDWQLRPIIEKNGADYPFQHVKEEIKKADISFVNLESAFTTKEKKAPGQLFW
ncbi:CapA family protein, partial [Acinetobacter baumannii]|nr:CapA family protein [Acinetobacter baumannii]